MTIDCLAASARFRLMAPSRRDAIGDSVPARHDRKWRDAINARTNKTSVEKVYQDTPVFSNNLAASYWRAAKIIEMHGREGNRAVTTVLELRGYEVLDIDFEACQPAARRVDPLRQTP